MYQLGLVGRAVLEADLVTDVVAQLAVFLVRHAFCHGPAKSCQVNFAKKYGERSI